MPIDPSIYSNVQNPGANSASPVDSLEKGMRLSALGMQQAQMGYQMQTQTAVRGAYARNTDPQTGQLNRAGFLSELGKAAPMAASEYQNQFIQQDKQAAEAKSAQMQAAHQTVSVALPYMDYMVKQVPQDQAANVWPNIRKQMGDLGIPLQNVPPSDQWDPSWGKSTLAIMAQSKEGLENQMIQSNVATAPIQRNADLYGSRSPSNVISEQYGKDTTPIKSSHMAMNQMIDNYKNPSPQGDASLVLNAYKIKFPNAPDVNSLEELSKAQSAPDAFKQAANKVLSGGLDQATRDNLMRDGISTFRANVNTLRGYQQKYYSKALSQNIPGAEKIIAEPGIDKTYAQTQDLQKQIGPYVPPSQRGGVTGALSSFASKVAGIGGSQPANASPSIKPGAVEDGYVFMGGDPGKQSSWKRAK